MIYTIESELSGLYAGVEQCKSGRNDENDRVSCVQRPFDRVFEKFREESAGQCRIYRTMSEEYGQAGFEVFAGKKLYSMNC